MSHRLVVTIDSDCISKSPLNARIVCDAPADADCRCLDPLDDPRGPEAKCAWVAHVEEWVLDAYDGDRVALSDGPVRFWVDGEDVYWAFADDRDVVADEPLTEAVPA